MSMVCPQCRQMYEQALKCPSCGCRLEYQLRAMQADENKDEQNDNWQETPWGRILVGLLIAQGLGYGLQQMFSAGQMAISEDSSATAWSGFTGLILLHVLQGMCLILGGALAGAGQTRGVFFGSLIGMINGLIFLVVQRHTDGLLQESITYAQPIVHVIFGALGGLIGMSIWKPAPVLKFENEKPTPGFSWASLGTFKGLQGPVSLGRVLMGIVVVVCGVASAKVILQYLLDLSGGTLTISDRWQNKVVLLEISAVATVLGAALAGSITHNGLKQGLCVGLGAGFILMGLELSNPQIKLEAILFSLITTLFFSMLGGWFGSKLFPPILRRTRRRIVDM